MKKILVTGATGFIGNHVIATLLKKNCQVIASSANLGKAGQAAWYPFVTYIPFDLGAYDSATDYYTFFGKPDLVIHLAWEGLPNYKAAFHVEENLPRHFSFLSNLVKHGLKDLTITGTCFEYGMREGCLSEDMEPHPGNSYAKAKDLLRRQVEKLAGNTGVIVKWVRLFYMYGQGQNPNSLLSQLDKAIADNAEVFNMSGGEQQRDYLKVEEVAEYIVTIALQHQVTGIINCCSGMPVTVRSLVEQYLTEKQSDIKLNLGYYPYPDYEPMRFWGDNKKLKTILKNE